MTGNRRIILGISDLKNLFQSINSKYSIDFNNFAISSFKRRLEDFMANYRISNFDDLVHKFENDKDFFQLFINFQLVDSTEMFRDPEFWSEIKSILFSRYQYSQELKVLIPDCNSGDELYTFQIINSQLDFIKKTKVLVTTFSQTNIDRIALCQIDKKKMEINSANFERYMEGESLSRYFKSNVNFQSILPEYMQNIEIQKHNLVSENFEGIFDLILFRNKMLYFNPQLKIEVLKKLESVLKPGGYMAVGIKESVDHPGWEHGFSLISDSERIYKKKLS